MHTTGRHRHTEFAGVAAWPVYCKASCRLLSSRRYIPLCRPVVYVNVYIHTYIHTYDKYTTVGTFFSSVATVVGVVLNIWMNVCFFTWRIKDTLRYEGNVRQLQTQTCISLQTKDIKTFTRGWFVRLTYCAKAMKCRLPSTTSSFRQKDS